MDEATKALCGLQIQEGLARATTPTSQAAIRALKVEDALLFLDQVKLEFFARPEIYNEFLEIMRVSD